MLRFSGHWSNSLGCPPKVIWFAMARVDQLRRAIARCRDRKAYCERQLTEFAKSADLSDRQQQRALGKLRLDLQRVESDLSWLQKQLDDLMD
jgi:hypothetical protein